MSNKCKFCTLDIDGTAQMEVVKIKGVDDLQVILDVSSGKLQVGILTEPNSDIRGIFKKKALIFDTAAKYCPYCGKRLELTADSDKSYDYIIEDNDSEDFEDFDDYIMDEDDDFEDFDDTEDSEDFEDFDDTEDYEDDDFEEITNLDEVDEYEEVDSDTEEGIDAIQINRDSGKCTLTKYFDTEEEVNEVLINMGLY